MADITNPHFAVPFYFDHNNVAGVVEQGSIDDFVEQVEAIARTVRGQRLDLPDFGRDDVGFTEGTADTNRLIHDIERYAPDAIISVDTSSEGIELLMQKIRISVQEGSGT
jgi:hypothetical protein